MLHLVVAARDDAVRALGRPGRELADAADCREGGGHVAADRIDDSIEALTPAAVSSAPSEKCTSRRSSQDAPAAVIDRSHFSQSQGSRCPLVSVVSSVS